MSICSDMVFCLMSGICLLLEENTRRLRAAPSLRKRARRRAL